MKSRKNQKHQKKQNKDGSKDLAMVRRAWPWFEKPDSGSKNLADGSKDWPIESNWISVGSTQPRDFIASKMLDSNPHFSKIDI